MKIEKNIPAPSGYGANVSGKYPWRKMDVGDSVFFDNEPDKTQSNPAAAARLFSRKNPEFKFATRSEGNGVRVWRVA